MLWIMMIKWTRIQASTNLSVMIWEDTIYLTSSSVIFIIFLIDKMD